MGKARYPSCYRGNSVRVDYANTVLYNMFAWNIAKHQRVQSTLSRVVSSTNKTRTKHIRPVLQKLHWLPISFCIDYKIAKLIYTVLTTCCTDYRRQSVHFYTRHLRSTNQLLLTKPTTRTVISSRAFSRAAPTIWNSLPHHIRIAHSLDDLDSHCVLLYSLAFH